ncbi:MAG TPA: sulfatase [Planctomycetaceae bacterium]|nr:sulfatase [Planctomycetaceae bacterium]
MNGDRFSSGDPLRDHALMMTRRHFFGRSALGVGTAALAGLLPRSLAAGAPLVQDGLHHPAKAKAVIYLFKSGGPSQHDMWDYKPKLKELANQQLPESVRDGQRITGMTANQANGLPLCPSKYDFERCDNNDQGVWVSSLLPHTRKIVKHLAVVHSTFTEAINHDPAITYIQTGSQVPGRPSLGAWLSYGLGSSNENLPHYVVMHAQSKFAEQSLFNRLWGTGFMPSEHQGTLLRSVGDPVLYLSNPQGIRRDDRRAQLDALAALDQEQYERFADPEVLSRISQHEMAFRMQTSIPELMDWSREPADIDSLYGEDLRKPGTFASCCLTARRLVERGVRNIQIFHRGWDAHGNLPTEHEGQCKDIDQACYGLITDLERLGLLDQTLVVWGGEFGRTAYCQGNFTAEDYGRDHHPRCFTTWFAGGGIKPGITYGRTDEFGYNITDADGVTLVPQPDKETWTPGTMHIHDLNATILHLLGIDHTRLTYRYQGRDFRLTDIHGHVIHDLIA